jgi:hypothetical protein
MEYILGIYPMEKLSINNLRIHETRRKHFLLKYFAGAHTAFAAKKRPNKEFRSSLSRRENIGSSLINYSPTMSTF